MPKKAAAPPVVADPAAAARLEAAAAAAGLSVEQLADLVIEAGVRPAPTSDGITQRYTLQELGQRLWGSMQAVQKPERAEWFAALLPVQKGSLIAVLRERGFRTEIIARELGIEAGDVMRIWNAYASNLGAQVVGIRLDTIAGQLQMAAERSAQMAIEAKDHNAYWRIQKELVASLQSIGIIDQAIRRVEVTHKLDDEQKAELERIAALRNKQEKRRLEIEEIKDADVGDALPDELAEDYDDDD